MPKAYQFHVSGMDCAEEVTALKRDIGPLVNGEQNLSFDLMNGRMTVRASEPSAVRPEDIVEAVRRMGMTAVPIDDRAKSTSDDSNAVRRRLIALTAISGTAAVAGFVAHALLGDGVTAAIGESAPGAVHTVPLTVRLFYCIAIIAGTWTFLPKA